MSDRHAYWTSKSILALAGSRDPVAAITEKARSLILSAVEAGLAGPPFDPRELATYAKIPVVPRDDIVDARTVPSGPGICIEFNPNRPRARVRYSIAHELAHTLFPDCADRIRHRGLQGSAYHQDVQLETLCNIGAAEILMPIGSFPDLKSEAVSIDNLMDLRRRYDVSAEAVLLRFVRLTSVPCMMFCASRRDEGGRYHIEYAVPSRGWPRRVMAGSTLPLGSLAEGCTAVGFTAKGKEEWSASLGLTLVECIGVPPHPGRHYPRVVGLLKPVKRERSLVTEITYIKGNATQPRGAGEKLLAHIVNDKASTWGGGFAFVVRKTWPLVQEDFKRWATEKSHFVLGNIHISPVNESLRICHMIAQHGYGPSPTPRIRYDALRKCLEALRAEALPRTLSVHMPFIGTGQAGGSWEIVSELVENSLSQSGVPVLVYQLPNAALPKEAVAAAPASQ